MKLVLEARIDLKNWLSNSLGFGGIVINQFFYPYANLVILTAVIPELQKPILIRYKVSQSCKSGRAFRVGFGPGSGLKLTKMSGLIRAWDELFVLGVQKNNQNYLAILLNFKDLTLLADFFGHDLGFKLIFGFGLIVSGSGRVRAWSCRPVYNSEVSLSDFFISNKY